MATKFINTIVFVSDLNRSKDFYIDVLGLTVKKELESIIFFENNLVLHDARSILNNVFKRNHTEVSEPQGTHNILIYFECDSLVELEKLYKKAQNKAKILHEIQTQDWGQRVFRLLDPDGHILECGESQS